MFATLSGCGGGLADVFSGSGLGGGTSNSRLGGVAADEPHAAIYGRDVLDSGGSAVDAAVAMYFTMAVTYPSAATLGGGGVCVVFDGKTKAEALDFTLGRPSAPVPIGGIALAIPGNVRGMFALHARYGRQRWETLLGVAENYARFGHNLSRAFAAELGAGSQKLRVAPGDGDPFVDGDGGRLKEGQNLVQLQLALALSAIRVGGAGAFYGGKLAQDMAAGAEAVGAVLSIDDLRAYRPIWRDTIRVEDGNNSVHFPPEPVRGGAIAAALWRDLAESGDFDVANPVKSMLAPLRKVMRETDAGRGWRYRDGSVAGLAAVDGRGQSVACTFSANGRFGAHVLLRGTGIVAAAAPGAAREDLAELAPMLYVNDHIGQTFAAAAGSGDSSAAAAVTQTMGAIVEDNVPPADAIRLPRVSAGAEEGQFVAETAAGEIDGDGDTIGKVPSLGRVNLVVCPNGLPRSPRNCAFVTDPRGHGFASGAGL